MAETQICTDTFKSCFDKISAHLLFLDKISTHSLFPLRVSFIRSRLNIHILIRDSCDSCYKRQYQIPGDGKIKHSGCSSNSLFSCIFSYSHVSL